jgi:ABC-type nitrate/sulfonate/bicarbonate transport system substrate-binding protein
MSLRPWSKLLRAAVATLAHWCLGAIAALAVCVSCFAQQGAPQKIRVLCLTRPLPVVIAESRGILAKYGIELEFLVRPSSESLRSDLAAGKGDVAFLAVDNDVAMMDSAGVDVVIVMGAESSENEIIAQPGTKSIADLRGHTLLVDATNTAYALELKKVLQMNGMHPGKEYQLKPVGSTPFRLQAMRDNKDYAAAVMNPPFSIVAKQGGMVSLGSMRTLLGADLDRGTFALRMWALGNSDLLVRYLAAYIEGQRWLMAPSNRQQVVELVMKESNLPESTASDWYAAMVQNSGYAKDAAFDVEGFKKTLQLRAEIEADGNGAAPAAEKYYDLSYYRMALSKIK